VKTPELKKFISNLDSIKSLTSTNSNLFLNNCSGSLSSIIISHYFKEAGKNIVIIHEDIEKAGYLFNDIKNILDSEEELLFFPSTYKRSIHLAQQNLENIVLRTETLNSFSDNVNKIIITTPKAVMEKLISKSKIESLKTEIKIGDTIEITKLKEKLFNLNFEIEDFVYEPGQFSIRGGIVDIFSYSSDNPYRIGFFGDEVENIRQFDIETQLSIKSVKELIISPDIVNQEEDEMTDFFSLLPEDTTIFTTNIDYLISRINTEYEALNFEDEEKAKNKPKQKNFLTGAFTLEKIKQFRNIEFGFQKYLIDTEEINLDSLLQPKFNRNFDLLIEELENKILEGYEINILYKDEKQAERLKTIFSQNGLEYIKYIDLVLNKGFVSNQTKQCFYTDHEIFGRYNKTRVKTNISQKRAAVSLKEINSLQKGDYVVHTEYGVGTFIGLHKMNNLGKKQEVIKIEYKEGDTLYVNIHSLHKISKYKSKDGLKPTIHKLGSRQWIAKKNKVKSKLKELAVDLIQLYAKRKMDKAFAYSPDSFLQEELEASFLYEDTPDQRSTTDAVKQDMESDKSMDRLVCGDVGFGKTEIAIRAAFKAVCDGKQVAVLVPTTILAFQHYRSFQSRLKRLPCTINYLTRFRSAKTKTQIKKELESGELNILIGTHSIVNKNLKYKDIGLLIIDEEQKFGVAIKEKIKELKANIDTLTLTATPIPRTLQFSLMGARDISVIKTPPPNRIPITTELHGMNSTIIREAISYEVERGGQVFFVHNRVQNITEVQAMIHRIVPGINSVIVHGQMKGQEIEDKLIAFMNAEYDVLIATSIIENGIDIPNANTIIINNAHHFGLSDLHQMRGRVGRSNKKAFCYLIAPELTTLPKESQQRLRVISEYSELGSGINIAMQDMDIRGAGNVFGAEQSGFIADIGYETYMKILNETIRDLKTNEFKELYAEEIKGDIEAGKFVDDCTIETDLEVLLPETYIENISERINLYRKIDNLNSEEEIEKLQSEMVDKFGEIPYESQQLFDVVRLRWLATGLGMEKIVIKLSKMICYFVNDQTSEFYSSTVFVRILEFAQKQLYGCELKEAKKLMMKFQNINNIETAYKLLKKI
jgi:transcription-repair coupling factor (superfamily II helicase)